MKESLQSFAETLGTLETADAVWARTERHVADLGLPFCTLTMAKAGPDGPVSSRFYSNLNREFSDTYRYRLLESDPFLAIRCRSLSPGTILTDPDRFPGANGRQRDFLELAAAQGVSTCLGIPVRTRDQAEFGGWVIGGSDDATEFEAHCAEHGAEVQLTGLLAFERMAAIARIEARTGNRLSPRERECLLWLSAGLRVAMIADRLDLSEAAVNLYIRNARAKLGARTREQAVARAILSGEIDP